MSRRLIDPKQAYEIARMGYSDFALSLADLTSLRELFEDCDTVEVPRWIPVTERLPEDRQRVLVRMIDGTMDVWEFQNYGIGWWQSAIWKYRTEAITHWMPLPDAPKDGDSE